MSVESYPKYYTKVQSEMGAYGKANPDLMAGFRMLSEAAVTDGALDVKTKELMALAIGIVVRCDGCIAFHVHDALKAGASEDEIVDAIGVAIMMGGGPAVVSGSAALEALKQFQLD
ncbi:MAG: carboxymuconolactone decarboxylase family protein [Anaerolineales bacterium]|nr:carboxymuconolactone decarboxylase family protein [Anaerolineales bacterium]